MNFNRPDPYVVSPIMMKKMGFKPRRRKKIHQWWESPWIDYDTPLQMYY